MAETIYNLSKDLREAEQMVQGLIPYVYEEQIYANVGTGGIFASKNTPSLTLGALLMRLRRLHEQSNQMSDAQRATLERISYEHERVRNEWTLHYNNKLVQEANSRLKLLNQYFHDCQEDPRTCANAYLPEALRRTIVQEIADTLEQQNMASAELDNAIRNADSGLRRYTVPSDFIWSQQLQPMYPKSRFWWLYAKPQVREKNHG